MDYFYTYGHFPSPYILNGHLISYGQFSLWTLFHMDILPYGQFADSPVAQNEWKKHPYMFFLFLVKKKRV